MSNQDKINNSFNTLDRKLFMEDFKEYSNVDLPFSIGYGQTISQPSLVLKMTLHLDPNQESRVLEIGTGSGFQTALLSKVSKEVYTVEIIKELHESAKERLSRLGYNNIKYKLDDGHLGWSKFAPYDRIMVTACAEKIPKALVGQLNPNGKMVIAIKSDQAQDLLIIKKDRENNISQEFLGKVKFVDLV